MFFPLINCSPFNNKLSFEFASFQRFLLRTYFNAAEGAFITNYFSASLQERNWIKKYFAKVQVKREYIKPTLVAIGVTSDFENAILAPYLIFCDSNAKEFQLCQLGEFERTWDIKFTEEETHGFSFYGAVIMDGPVVAFVYKDHSETSDSALGAFEENNTYILLWKSSHINSTCSFAISADCIYGFWLPFQHNEYHNMDDSHRVISVIFRPLYEHYIKMICLKNDDFISKDSTIPRIPGYYSRITTCLARSHEKEIIWVGTSQTQIICFKDNNNKGEMKLAWCTIITGMPLLIALRKQVQLDKRVTNCESVLIVQIVDGKNIIINSESGAILQEISSDYSVVFGEFSQIGFNEIMLVPHSFEINTSSLKMILTEVKDASHMSSLIDSLSNRIYDGTAQTRKIKEMLDQKYNLLAHCDSLLECFSDIFAFYHLHQVTFKKRNLCINKSIEKLLPLLVNTPIMLEDMKESITNNNQYLCVLEARIVYGEISKKDKILIEVMVQNLAYQELYAVHLTAYLKNTSKFVSSLIRIRSSRIEVLSAGQEGRITALVDLPLDLILSGLEFGILLWYQTITKSNIDQSAYSFEDYEWHSLYVDNIRTTNTMKNDLIDLLPSVSCMIFTTPISSKKQWNLTMLPFLFEQYLDVVASTVNNNLFQEFKSTDELYRLILLRPYYNINENDDKRQMMMIRCQNDRLSIPSPVFTSNQSLNNLNSLIEVLEDITGLNPEHNSNNDKHMIQDTLSQQNQ
ncbi:1449_t:CDS:10, partial [Gigaspora rosea]